MSESLKQSLAKAVCLLCGIVGFLAVSAQPAFAQVEGDIELLKLIANGFEANFKKIRTWKGTAYIKGSHTAIPIVGCGAREWERQNEFLIDRDLGAVRWHYHTVKATEQKEGKMVEAEPDSGSGMIKGEIDYRLTIPEKESWKRSLLIIPKGQLPRNIESNLFDPVFILESEIYPDKGLSGLTEWLMWYYDNATNVKLSDVTVKREGDIVTFQAGSKINEGAEVINRFVFDLSKGCLPVECLYLGPTISHWECDYEKAADVFVLKKVSYTYEDKHPEQKYTSKVEAMLTNEMVNEPVDHNEFELGKIGMRPGDMVNDKVAGGISYIWDGKSSPRSSLMTPARSVLYHALGGLLLWFWSLESLV